MIVDRFNCPMQDPAAFTFERCHSCPKFEMNIGGKNGTSIRCRANKERADKRDFESAILLWRLGMEYHVEIRHPGGTAGNKQQKTERGSCPKK